MNSTSLEKHKKGNLYVYKFGTGSKTPEYQPPTAVAVTKRIISSSIWGGLRKSKSKPKTGLDYQDKEKGDNKNGIRNDDEKVKEIVSSNNGRKSVSSVEGILLSLGNERKSTKDGANGTLKMSVIQSVRERNGKMEGSRKSVSHVENNKAYVGKFVEKPRKSTGSKLESNVESAGAVLQVKVLVTDMPGFMQIHAFQCARNTYDTLEKFSARHLASNLKKEFDKVYGPAWHCIVGSSFGSFVTHATGCFLYFSMEKLCILLFRTKVQRAVHP